jgi:hypothetical protein
MKRRTKHARQVEQLLKDYPQTRNSDSVLIIGMLQINGAQLTKEQKRIILGMTFEGITRERRKLQEAGQYLPTDPAVAKKRRIKGYEVQQVAPTSDAQGLHDRIANNG